MNQSNRYCFYRTDWTIKAQHEVAQIMLWSMWTNVESPKQNIESLREEVRQSPRYKVFTAEHNPTKSFLFFISNQKSITSYGEE
jgi:hypothetical protein